MAIASATLAVPMLPAFSAALVIQELVSRAEGGKTIYTIPVTLEADGYSTVGYETIMPAGLAANTTHRMVQTASGTEIRITPKNRVETPEEILVVVSYLGKTAIRPFTIPTAEAEQKEAEVQAGKVGIASKASLDPMEEPPGDPVQALPACSGYSIHPGTIIGNVLRIFDDCDQQLGNWPEASDGVYQDYRITEVIPLPAPGGLARLLEVLETRFGMRGQPNLPAGTIDFIYVGIPHAQ